jgi:hypothetical protein
MASRRSWNTMHMRWMRLVCVAANTPPKGCPAWYIGTGLSATCGAWVQWERLIPQEHTRKSWMKTLKFARGSHSLPPRPMMRWWSAPPEFDMGHPNIGRGVRGGDQHWTGGKGERRVYLFYSCGPPH